jgi:hypothetical protein
VDAEAGLGLHRDLQGFRGFGAVFPFDFERKFGGALDDL